MRWASAGRALWLVGVVAAANLAVVGCGRSWPAVHGMTHQELASHQRVIDTVDLMPLDVDFAVSRHAPAPVGEIMERFHAVTMGTVQAELQRRGYRVHAAIQWDGSYVAPDGEPAVATEQQLVVDTADSLRGYGYAQSHTNDGLLFPYLPHRLGTATGSDTTLYVGGWAFVGKKRTSTGKKVAKGVLIGALVVVVIAAAIAGAKKGGGGLLKGAGKVAGTGAKVVARAAGAAARSAGQVAQSAGQLAKGAGKVLTDATPRMIEATARATGRVTLRTLDAFGHTNTHIDIYGGDPAYYERDIPRKGYSRMLVEMTLVDNRTGETLWHARQLFNVSAANNRDTAKAMQLMMASLPPSR